MAHEKARGCGFRKVGGLYLVGAYIPVSCDRLPFRLQVCPVCGAGIKAGRGMTEINPLKLFGFHDDEAHCHDKLRPCFLCDPSEKPAFLMKVGEKFYPTPDDFLNEGVMQGFSKRIAQIPKNFKVGETIVYLAHPKACSVQVPVGAVAGRLELWQEPDGASVGAVTMTRLIDADKQEKAMGIFTAFIPQRIEKLYWQSRLDNMTDKEREHLAKRGITPVGIPDGDADHR